MTVIKNFAGFLGESVAQYLTPTNMTTQQDPYVEERQRKLQQYARLQNIMMSVFAGTGNQMNSRDELDFEIQNLTVKRIFRNTGGTLDVHVRFESEEVPFHGAFYNWGNPNGATFKSEYMDAKRFHKENRLRFEGILANTLLEWFKPEEGAYTCLKDTTLLTFMGTQVTIPAHGKVAVEEVLTEDNKPTIFLNYLGERLALTGLDYYYFHWWFDAAPTQKFYF